MPIDANEELFCAFEAQWGRLNILYASEMDGIDANEGAINVKKCEMSALKFVQAKAVYDTEFHTEYCKPWKLYQNTYRKWWCEARLANTTNIFRGIYNDRNIITHIASLDPSSIPQMRNVSIFYIKNVRKCVWYSKKKCK